ncbi:MAG: menaquinone biosynthesis decarboxylase [Firmicutes bacterium]|nr:menaquinone biosynthesis decarboxylase [Bacillota bacterium]
MAYRNLGEFISLLEKKGMLKRIKTEVDSNLEVTEIADRMVKKGGPALLFEKIKGYEIPLAINLFGTMERMNLALGVSNFDEIADRIRELLAPPEVSTFIDKLKAIPLLQQISRFFPVKVKNAPCQEIVIKETPMLSRLPVLKCWPLDGGKFITLPMVFSKDPRNGSRNVGMYRMQIYDDGTTGMHWHLHKHGSSHYRGYEEENKVMPVAVALGGDPAVILASTAPLPKEVDEMVFAGFLRSEPVEMVKCLTCDIEVPAESEIILEGYVNPGEKRIEGPFGDHTGYYSASEDYPVFHLTCITMRKNAVYPATIVGKPPMEDYYMGKAVERIFLPLLQLQLPEITDMNFPAEGVFHNCLLVSIKKTYPGQGRKVINALWGMGQMMFAKLIVVVDDTVNIQDLNEAAYKSTASMDAERDIVITRGPLDALDHSSPAPRYGAKIGIDLTSKGVEEGMPRAVPPEIKMSDDIKKLVDTRWKEYGLEGFQVS